ncbi:antibiotic biosynthesis monooxygenase [Streptomyces iconiensis]|uniref:Antibiotic biosynthesis monooxygenase n=1 Tax=Streptomyces iconiensis TaxID=1384038 RepID=A0ABT7A1L6_9ACTN|nr:antibiotic biosynthesis monooxygenase [Streptomyces iconiensis]MDJ1134967.1 antibiotic biosynthesis monooxygenase [Streptomyces iconiensis]
MATPERQRAVAEAMEADWAAHPWPSPTLLSRTVLMANDGHTLLRYSQVTDLARPPHPPLPPGEELPDGDRELIAARLYRSQRVPGASGPPGCVVLVDRAFDRPDPEGARHLVDTLFESASGQSPADGLIGAYFYVSSDGTRVLNYAEWTDEQAHKAAIGNRPRGNAQWEEAHTWPGLRRTNFLRFRPHAGTAAP